MAELALIGRADELELARGLLRRAADGAPGVLLVGGEAGVGPQPARDGDRRRGHGATGSVPRPAPASGWTPAPSPTPRSSGCCVAWPARSTRVRSRAPSAPTATRSRACSPRSPRPRARRRRHRRRGPDGAHPAVRGASPAGSTGSPERERLLLAVEDLHWADAATLDLVRALALGLAGRTALVVTLRTDEALAATGPGDGRRARARRRGAHRARAASVATELVRLVAGGAAGCARARRGRDRPSARAQRRQPVPRPRAPRGRAAGSRDGDRHGAAEPPRHPRRPARCARRRRPRRAPGGGPPARADRRRPARDPSSGARCARWGPALRQAARGRRAGRARRGPSPSGTRSSAELLVEQLGPGERRALHAAYADALEGTPDPARATAAAWHRDASGDEPAGARRPRARRRRGHLRRGLRSRRPARGPRRRRCGSASRHAAAEGLPGRRVAARPGRRPRRWLGGDPAGSARLRPVRPGGRRRRPDPRRRRIRDRLRWALWESGDRAGRRPGDPGRRRSARRATPHPPCEAMLVAQSAAVRMDEADPGHGRRARRGGDRASPAQRGRRDAEALALGVLGRTLATHGRVDAGPRPASARGDRARRGRRQPPGPGGRRRDDRDDPRPLGPLPRGARRHRRARSRPPTPPGSVARSGLSCVAQAARACLAIGEWDAAGVAGRAGPRAPPGRAGRGGAQDRGAPPGRRPRPGRESGGARGQARRPRERRRGPGGCRWPAGRAGRGGHRRRPSRGDARRCSAHQLAELAAGLEPSPSAAWLAGLAAGAEAEMALDARGRGDEAATREAEGRLATIVAVVRNGDVGAAGALGPARGRPDRARRGRGVAPGPGPGTTGRRVDRRGRGLGGHRPPVLRRLCRDAARGGAAGRRRGATRGRARRSGRRHPPPGAWAPCRSSPASSASRAWPASTCRAPRRGRGPRDRTRPPRSRRRRPARDARADAARARDPSAGRRRLGQRPHRRRARDQHQHGVGPRVEHAREARRREPGRGRGPRPPARGRRRRHPPAPAADRLRTRSLERPAAPVRPPGARPTGRRARPRARAGRGSSSGPGARSGSSSSSQRIGAETGAPARGRTAYGATSVLIAAFCV